MSWNNIMDHAATADRLAALETRMRIMECDVDELKKCLDSLRKTKYPVIADDRTVFALQQEIYSLRRQIGEMQQFVFLSNRICQQTNQQ